MQKRVVRGKKVQWIPFLGITWNVQGYTYDPVTQQQTHVWGYNPKRDKVFMIPMHCINSPQKIADEFAKHGVQVMDSKVLQSYIHEYKNTTRQPIMSRMGWVDKHKDEFVLPSGKVSMDNLTMMIEKPLVNPDIQPVLDRRDSKQCMGTDLQWLDAVSLYSVCAPSLQVAILASMAAPLYEMLDIQNGSILSLISSKSGTGKSTVLEVADSVWGRPLSPSTLTKRDTDNGRLGVLSAYGNLPVTFDEHTTMHPNQVQDFIFSVAEGTDKNAMNEKRALQAMRSWKTLVISTGNVSLKDKLRGAMATDSDAAMKRVCDLLVPQADKQLTKNFTELLNDVETKYYGAMGRTLVASYMLSSKFIAANYDAYHTHFEGLSDERFTARLFALVMTVAELLTDLNYNTFFDKDELLDYLTDELVSQAAMNQSRLVLEQFIPADLVGQYSQHIVPKSAAKANQMMQSVHDHTIPRLPHVHYLWNDGDSYYCHKQLVWKYIQDNKLHMSLAGVLNRWKRNGLIEATSENENQFDKNLNCATYTGFSGEDKQIWQSTQMKVLKFTPTQ